MKAKQASLFGIVLATLIVATTLVTGALIGQGGATVEAGALEGAPAIPAEEMESGQELDEVVANCRYGAATKRSTDQVQWLDELGAGWWLDFQVNYADPAPNGAEYMHVIWVYQKKDAGGNYLDDYVVNPTMDNDSLGWLLRRRPGRMWLIGNEVDRGPNPDGFGGQGDTMPQLYARIYHELYHYIKKWDPTALVSPSALVEFTPNREQYLDIVWDTYMNRYGEPMPADFWNMHLYILPELRPDGSPNGIASVALGTDPAHPTLGAIFESGGNLALCPLDNVYCMAEHDDPTIFAQQVVRMRQWMKDHGYQNYPLLITEYSLLYKYEKLSEEPGDCVLKDENGECFTRERTRDYALDTFNYLETAADPKLGYPYDNHRLVQQWMWYSVHQTSDFATSNLAVNGSGPLSLTLAGQAFSDAARAEPAAVNLMAIEALGATGRAVDGSTSVQLSVEIRNNGNTRVNEPIKISFYLDAALNQEIAQTTIPAPDADFIGMTGCAVRSLKVPVVAKWPEELSPGDYPFWVKVDSNGAIGETNEGDNVSTGTFKIVPVGVFIPLVAR